MVVPLTSEREWSRRLDGVPWWKPIVRPTVVVVPHPDDEALAAGGLIAALTAKGVDLTVVAVTDGEHAYSENNGLATLRRREQTCALARLGVAESKIVRLGLLDSGVETQEMQLADQLRPLIHGETQLVAPWGGDFHPDHEACARAAGIVAREAGAKLISYFFWTWHRGTVATLDGINLGKFSLSNELLDAKQAALACHQSQLSHAPEPEILPENLLWPARMPFEVFAL